jgi:hypothetical protein
VSGESNGSLGAKVWNYAHVLRDAGVSYGDYLEQITCLLFLKMDEERTENLDHASIIPDDYHRDKLRGLKGEALSALYGRALAELGRADGLLGAIFQKARNTIEDPGPAATPRATHRRGAVARPPPRRERCHLRGTSGAQCAGSEVRRRPVIRAAPANRGHRAGR